jgi:hypothetical protein
MEGEIVASALRIVVDGGDHSGKIREFLFVPQVLEEFDRYEFTVSVHAAVEQVGLEQ